MSDNQILTGSQEAEPQTTALSAAERALRKRVLKRGIIAYSDGAITIECTVRDVSESGVRLQLTKPIPVPDTFRLSIPMDGIKVDCVIRWRDGNLLGAAFVGEPVIAIDKNQPQLTRTEAMIRRQSILRKEIR